jgi:hypothetical protein
MSDDQPINTLEYTDSHAEGDQGKFDKKAKELAD